MHYLLVNSGLWLPLSCVRNSIKGKKQIVVILHICGARAIFHQFNDDQDTLSTYREIKMSISKLIFTHKIISKSIFDNDIHTI